MTLHHMTLLFQITCSSTGYFTSASRQDTIRRFLRVGPREAVNHTGFLAPLYAVTSAAMRARCDKPTGSIWRWWEMLTDRKGEGGDDL